MANLVPLHVKCVPACDSRDLSNCKEVFFLKKLSAGNCMWSTCQVLLGWVIDTVDMTFPFPPHQENRFKEILDVIPTNQKRIGVDKWHRVIGYLWSIDIALTGAWGLFIHMQEALCHVEGKWWSWLRSSTRPSQTSNGWRKTLVNALQDCMRSCWSSLHCTAITMPPVLCV